MYLSNDVLGKIIVALTEKVARLENAHADQARGSGKAAKSKRNPQAFIPPWAQPRA